MRATREKGKSGETEGRVEAPFSQCSYSGAQFFKRRELLLRAPVPPHKHREPCHPDASDDGHEPLLPRHAGKLEQNGVNPAHGSLAKRPILGAGGVIRKAERGDMPDRVGAAAAGTGRGDARMEGLTAADFDRDRVSGINLRCRMVRMDLSKRCGDRGQSRTWAG